MTRGTNILEHTPEDMTVTVEAGMTLASLQVALGRYGQWLAIDPPHPERLTLGELINLNASGPRRFGCGTIRDHLIGCKVALADGTIIHSGGKVVKNVAGYDLMKLFIGARGSLGTVLETTFKLRPLPEEEKFVQAQCKSLEEADRMIEGVVQADITPVVLDLAGAECGERRAESGDVFILVLGFAGTREDVEWQLSRAQTLGFKEAGSLEHETKFWSDAAPARRLSVLPSKIAEALRAVQGPFVARAGNGVIYHRGAATTRKESLPLELMRRLKAAFDPKNLLPEMPL